MSPRSVMFLSFAATLMALFLVTLVEAAFDTGDQVTLQDISRLPDEDPRFQQMLREVMEITRRSDDS